MPRPISGDVVPDHPAALPAAPDNELYLAVAQVHDGSNLAAGIQRLQEAIERHKPARPDFYYQLARAHRMAGDSEAVLRWSRRRARRDASGFVPALKELAGGGQTDQSVQRRLQQSRRSNSAP